MPGPTAAEGQVREVHRLAVDAGSDLAVLKIDGDPLPALKLRDSDSVREGQEVLMTGFPIGAVLGPFPATHRGMISAITPIAIPQARAAELDPAVIRRLATGTFPVFQLDATAYPGNSGSPIYDPRHRRRARHRQHGVREGNEGGGAHAAERHHVRGAGEPSRRAFTRCGAPGRQKLSGGWRDDA